MGVMRVCFKHVTSLFRVKLWKGNIVNPTVKIINTSVWILITKLNIHISSRKSVSKELCAKQRQHLHKLSNIQSLKQYFLNFQFLGN